MTVSMSTWRLRTFSAAGSAATTPRRRCWQLSLSGGRREAVPGRVRDGRKVRAVNGLPAGVGNPKGNWTASVHRS